jgi:putative nucleotidyltransferase with HDIG domain
MSRLDDLKKKVEELYHEEQPERDSWADWLYENHVTVVASYAKSLAEKYGADIELSELGGLLHDIADYKMKRDKPSHETESLKIARELMKEFDYSAEEIALTVDDAIRYHSCRGDERPASKEGLVIATADAMAHFKTDFYVFAVHSLGKHSSLEEIKQWVLKKIDKDLYNKISFEEEREDALADYEMIKNLFSR